MNNMNKIIITSFLILLTSAASLYAQSKPQSTSAYCYENKISVASLDARGNIVNEVTVNEGEKAENVRLNQPVVVVPMTPAELQAGKDALQSLSDADKIAIIRRMLIDLRNRLNS